MAGGDAPGRSPQGVERNHPTHTTALPERSTPEETPRRGTDPAAPAPGPAPARHPPQPRPERPAAQRTDTAREQRRYRLRARHTR
ncbi:hypothetical protein GCM10009730_53200 [Streptomyces albidochromogenes]